MYLASCLLCEHSDANTIHVKLISKEYNRSKLSNPIVTNGLFHCYHLDESTFIFTYRGIRSNFSFLFDFSMKIKIANRRAQDGMLRFAASHLGLFCLPMSHKSIFG